MSGPTSREIDASPAGFAWLAVLSATITLEPGDVILTGTPPGVGFARQPPVYPKAGDVVEVEIGPLGVLRNPVIAAR